MSALKGVMTAQAIVLFVYGLPYLLVPKWATTLAQQLPLPENYVLRAVGIGFVILAYLEFQILRDLERYRGLTLAYALLHSLFFVTIVLQAFVRGFNGAAWYWWLNGVVTGVVAIALFVMRARATAQP